MTTIFPARNQLLFLVISIALCGCGVGTRDDDNNATVPAPPPINTPQHTKTQITKTKSEISTTSSRDSFLLPGTIYYTDGITIYTYPESELFCHPELKDLFSFSFRSKDIELYSSVFSLIRPSPTCDNVILQEVKGIDSRYRRLGRTWLVRREGYALIEILNEPTLIKWSPDGVRFLYELEDGLYQGILESTKISHQLVHSSTKTSQMFSWSPDGKWITYLSPTKGKYEIWLISLLNNKKRLLGRISLPASGFDPTVDMVQWSPTSDVIHITTGNGPIFLSLSGERISEKEFEDDDWLFCATNTEACIRKRGSAERKGYTRVAPFWVFCQENHEQQGDLMSGFSPNCTMRAIAQGKKLYLNNLLSGDINELAEVENNIVDIMHWSPDDELIVFSERPDLTQDEFGKVYSLSLASNELNELPIRGLMGVCFR